MVPRNLCTAFLGAVHAGAINGHPGIERTRERLQEIAYWRGWTSDVHAYVQRCPVCVAHRLGPRRKQGQMQQVLACDVMQKVHVDLVGPFPTSKKGYKYLLTAICGFTKYLVCVPIRDNVSATVADVLMKHLYLVYGPPEILVHDQGGEFWSDVMTKLAALLDIQPSKITSHRPNLNGVVERVHATLHSMFGKLVDENQRNWCELVPYVTYAYNTTSHGTTSFLPFYLMFLHRARTPIELMCGLSLEVHFEDEDAYVSEVSERMRKAFQVVRKQLQVKFERAKKRYDERVRSAKFGEGEFVWHFIPRTRKGLNRKWMMGNKGPYRIVRRLNDVNFVVQKLPMSVPIIVHIDRLTRFHGTIPKAWKMEMEKERTSDGMTDKKAADANTAGAEVTHAENAETHSTGMPSDIARGSDCTATDADNDHRASDGKGVEVATGDLVDLTDGVVELADYDAGEIFDDGTYFDMSDNIAECGEASLDGSASNGEVNAGTRPIQMDVTEGSDPTDGAVEEARRPERARRPPAWHQQYVVRMIRRVPRGTDQRALHSDMNQTQCGEEFERYPCKVRGGDLARYEVSSNMVTGACICAAAAGMVSESAGGGPDFASVSSADLYDSGLALIAAGPSRGVRRRAQPRVQCPACPNVEVPISALERHAVQEHYMMYYTSQ